MLGTRSNIAETEYSAFSQISVLRAKPGSLQTVFTRPKRARWVCRQTSCFLTTCHSQMAIIHCTMSFVSKQIEEQSGMCSAVLCVLLNSVCLYTSKQGDEFGPAVLPMGFFRAGPQLFIPLVFNPAAL